MKTPYDFSSMNDVLTLTQGEDFTFSIELFNDSGLPFDLSSFVLTCPIYERTMESSGHFATVLLAASTTNQVVYKIGKTITSQLRNDSYIMHLLIEDIEGNVIIPRETKLLLWVRKGEVQ